MDESGMVDTRAPLVAYLLFLLLMKFNWTFERNGHSGPPSYHFFTNLNQGGGLFFRTQSTLPWQAAAQTQRSSDGLTPATQTTDSAPVVRIRPGFKRADMN